MNIVHIRKWFQDEKLKYKGCRLIEYESLDVVDHHVVNDTREVYMDKYSIGTLRQLKSHMLSREVTENMLEYMYKGIDGRIVIDTFVKMN